MNNDWTFLWWWELLAKLLLKRGLKIKRRKYGWSSIIIVKCLRKWKSLLYSFSTHPLAYIQHVKILFDSIQACLISGDVNNGQEYGLLFIYVNFICECEICSWYEVLNLYSMFWIEFVDYIFRALVSW